MRLYQALTRWPYKLRISSVLTITKQCIHLPYVLRCHLSVPLKAVSFVFEDPIYYSPLRVNFNYREQNDIIACKMRTLFVLMYVALAIRITISWLVRMSVSGFLYCKFMKRSPYLHSTRCQVLDLCLRVVDRMSNR